MNKFLNTITGFSLLIGSVSFSQDKFTAFYPEENNDSPIYIKNFEKTNKDTKNYTLAKSSVSDNTLKALYGNDAWEYTQSKKDYNSVIIAKPNISSDLIKELYQEI